MEVIKRQRKELPDGVTFEHAGEKTSTTLSMYSKDFVKPPESKRALAVSRAL